MHEDQIIRDAQYRKGMGIAYFNSQNAAIELAKTLPVGTPEAYVKDFISKWRDIFIGEYNTYYATVISKIGAIYSPEKAIERLNACKDLKELTAVWLSFSEDERHDEAVIKVKNDLKTAYEKA